MGKLFKMAKFPVNTVGIADMQKLELGEDLIKGSLFLVGAGFIFGVIGFAMYCRNSAWIGTSYWEQSSKEFQDLIHSGYSNFIKLDEVVREAKESKE